MNDDDGVVHFKYHRTQPTPPSTPPYPFGWCVQTISHDLLELLEKLQTSRLDDQRCVLPAYFTQVPSIHFDFFS